MDFKISERLRNLSPSATIAMSTRARALRAQGVNVISLALGESDFPPPDEALAGAIEAVHRGQTGYPAISGTAALKDAVIQKFVHENGLDFAPENILVGNGGKQLIYNAFAATLDPGDEVVIPKPYWVSYPLVAQMFGARVTHPECRESDGFRLSAPELARALTSRSRWVVLNFPNNPTGAVMEAEDLRAIAETLRQHPHIAILSDEIYEHLTFGDRKHVSLLNVAPDLAPRVLIVNGMSKAYAMTGWRVGFAAGPEGLIRAMTVIQSHATSGVCTLAQAGAAAALKGDPSLRAQMRSVYERRRDNVLSALKNIDGLTCAVPDGAFYVFPGVERLFGRVTPGGRQVSDDVALAEALLEEVHLATVPGSAFGHAGYLRLSIAASDDDLTEAMTRLRRFVQSLRG